MSRIFIFLFSCVLYLHVTVNAKSLNITFEIHGLNDTMVVLGHHFSGSLLPDDTAFTNSKGRGHFFIKDPLPQGMYFLYFNGSKFDFLLGEDQIFQIETDTVNLFENLKFKGSQINSENIRLQKELSVLNKKVNKFLEEKKHATDVRKVEIDALIKSLHKEFENKKLEFQENNKNNLLGLYLKASEEIPLPGPTGNENGDITDSSFVYRYYITHFFDNMDFTDPRLLRSPFYQKRVNRYIKKIVPQHPDSLIVYTDYLLQHTKNDPDLYKNMLINLFKYFGTSDIMGMDGVFLHIAENYYIPDAYWSAREYIEELKEKVEKQKDLVIGKVIPDVEFIQIPSSHFISAKNDSSLKSNVFVGNRFKLHQVNADYIVIYFWSPECGFCKKDAPKLHETVEELKSLNTVFISVNLLIGEEGKVEWIDFINKNQLYDWVNAWNPFSNDFRQKLNIDRTNQLFIIDKNKKIIAKGSLKYDQVLGIINAYSK